jgi:hypothetical protein
VTRAARWLIAVAAGCFLSGIVVGLVAPAITAAFSGQDRQLDADEQFLQEFARRYRLSNGQVELARAVLSERQQKRAEILLSDPQRLPEDLRSRYEQVQRHADQRLYALLDDQQRAKYREDARPGTGR